MEAFSVALACRMAKVPLTVIRGISNMAGDRDKANWNVTGALEAAAELVALRIST
jgi:futalosine hydrolase